jgi:hypothetical protein
MTSERPHTSRHRASLPERSRPAVPWPDDGMLDTVEAEQLEGLRVVACRHVNVVAAPLEQRDQRPEERHLWRV